MNEPNRLDREDLWRQLQRLHAHPFNNEVVHSPWSDIIDVETLYQDVKEKIREVVQNTQHNGTRCLTVRAAPGFGKTHLLAWTRAMVQQAEQMVFIFVPPYTGEGSQMEEHILRSVFDSLRQPSQFDVFKNQVRDFLARVHDKLNKGKWSILNWIRSPIPSIRQWPAEEQIEQLQEDFKSRDLFEQAFMRLEKYSPPTNTGLRLDWDAMVASCLLCCGEEEQSLLAQQWFTSPWMSTASRKAIYLKESCSGLDKVRNAIYTIATLLGRSMCFALDQMEDAFEAIQSLSQSQRQEIWSRFATLVRGLSETPGFCFLFMIQYVSWESMKSVIPPSFRDRMIASFGPQRLAPLSQKNALALIKARMNAFVWDQLENCHPPENEPYFPFSESNIETLRKDSNRELRGFLKAARVMYDQLLQSSPPSTSTAAPALVPVAQTPTPTLPPASPTPTPSPPTSPKPTLPSKPEPEPMPIKITLIRPVGKNVYDPDEVLIFGKNLVGSLKVLFNDQLATRITYKDAGIAVVPPNHLPKIVRVKVISTKDARNFDMRILDFEKIRPPRPYHKSLKRQLIRDRRINLGMTIDQLAEKINRTKEFVLAIEEDERDPADSTFESLADALNCSIDEFWDGMV